MLTVLILSPEGVIFEGKVESISLPGEKGIFEVLPFHKNFLSRLLAGSITVGERIFVIKRGIAKVKNDVVTIISDSISST